MVLKRRLPSKLTQENPTASKQDSGSTDVFADPIPTQAETPVENKAESVQEEQPKEDFQAHIPQEPLDVAPTAEEEEADFLKREVRKKPNRSSKPKKEKQEPVKGGDVLSQASSRSAIKDIVGEEDEVEGLPPVAARPDSDNYLDLVKADLKGQTVDPAQEEIEAAYMGTPEESEPFDVPNLDAPQPAEPVIPEPAVTEATDIVEPPKEEFPEPELIPTETPAEDLIPPMPEQPVEPMIEEPAPVEQEQAKEPQVEEAVDDFAPPPAFSEEKQDDIIETKPDQPEEDGWSFSAFGAPESEPMDTQGEEPEEQAPIAPEPQSAGPDVYSGVTLASVTEEAYQDNGGPPELPKEPMAKGKRHASGGLVKIAVVGAIVLLVATAVALVQSGDKTGKGLKKIGDSYADIQKDIPTEPKQAEAPKSVDALEAEMEQAIVANGGLTGPQEAPQVDLTSTPVLPEAVEPETRDENLVGMEEETGTQISFVDVDPDEADKPIMADGTEDMPEDIGAFAKLQKEITRLKAEKNATTGDGTPAAATQKPANVEEDLPTRADVEADLEAYRQLLMTADSPENIPKPGEYGKQLNAGQPRTMVDNSPVQAGLPPATLYEQNPYNLPVIPEPEVDAAPGLRTLNDFDLALFEPERPKVRIPKGIQPRLGATDFPQIEVLSFVPERGVIAVNRGREGVLLVGESVEGWELVGVYEDYAEFRHGTKKKIVSRE